MTGRNELVVSREAMEVSETVRERACVSGTVRVDIWGRESCGEGSCQYGGSVGTEGMTR